MNKFEPLTKYIKLMENDSIEHHVHMPYAENSRIVRSFIDDVYSFGDEHPEFEYTLYNKTLEDNAILCEKNSMSNADISNADAKLVIALIVCALRMDRFCEGALLQFFDNRSILKWLRRLEEIDKTLS